MTPDTLGSLIAGTVAAFVVPKLKDRLKKYQSSCPDSSSDPHQRPASAQSQAQELENEKRRPLVPPPCLPHSSTSTYPGSTESKEERTSRRRRPYVAIPKPIGIIKCINDGEQQSAGLIRNGIKWQATGLLHQGNTLREDQTVLIDDCFTGRLGPEGTNGQTENGRQRIEFMSWPPSENGQTWSYKWSYHLETFSYRYPRSFAFFAFMQLLSREKTTKGPSTLTLSLVGNELKLRTTGLEDPLLDRPVKREELKVKQARIENRTLRCELKVRFGEQGSIDFKVKDIESGQVLYDYQANNIFVPAKTSLKCGMYRDKVCGPAAFAIGDFEFERI